MGNSGKERVVLNSLRIIEKEFINLFKEVGFEIVASKAPISFYKRRPHDCAHTYLSPHDCAQTRLCPRMFVPRHICALTCYNRVVTIVSGQKHVRLCPDTYLVP